MHGHGVLNLSSIMVSQLKGTGTGLLNHHAKRGNKMVVMMEEPIPLNSKLCCFFLFSLIIYIIMSFNIATCRCCVVTNVYHHLRGERGGVFIKKLHNNHACNDCNGSAICIYHEQKTSA